jgi:hypothetical protein
LRLRHPRMLLAPRLGPLRGGTVAVALLVLLLFGHGPAERKLTCPTAAASDCAPPQVGQPCGHVARDALLRIIQQEPPHQRLHRRGAHAVQLRRCRHWRRAAAPARQLGACFGLLLLLLLPRSMPRRPGRRHKRGQQAPACPNHCRGADEGGHGNVSGDVRAQQRCHALLARQVGRLLAEPLNLQLALSVRPVPDAPVGRRVGEARDGLRQTAGQQGEEKSMQASQRRAGSDLVVTRWQDMHYDQMGADLASATQWPRCEEASSGWLLMTHSSCFLEGGPGGRGGQDLKAINVQVASRAMVL